MFKFPRADTGPAPTHYIAFYILFSACSISLGGHRARPYMFHLSFCSKLKFAFVGVGPVSTQQIITYIIPDPTTISKTPMFHVKHWGFSLFNWLVCWCSSSSRILRRRFIYFSNYYNISFNTCFWQYKFIYFFNFPT